MGLMRHNDCWISSEWANDSTTPAFVSSPKLYQNGKWYTPPPYSRLPYNEHSRYICAVLWAGADRRLD